jgi:hypothetical protein
MASSPLWKLRRLAARSRRVYTRRAGDNPAVGAYTKLVPLATAFIGAYDGAARYEATWRKEMGEGKGAVAALVSGIRAWLPRVTQDVTGFDPAGYGDKPEVPDDVMEDAERLVSLVDEHRDEAGNPLEYRDPALKALEPALAAAQKEWGEAEAADSTYQKLLSQVRTAAAAFDPELQAFRRTLAGAFGRKDKDYQKLRAERASHPDDEDDANAPKPAEPAKAAKPAEPAKPAEAAKPAEPAKPAEAAKPAEPPQPAAPVDAPKPGEPPTT